MDIILWGTGEWAENTLNTQLLKTLPDSIRILGFTDSDQKKWGGMIGKYIIFSPDQIKKMEYDSIVILSDQYYEEIEDMLIYWLHIAPDKIQNRPSLLRLLFRLKLIDKYKNTDDREIQDTLKYLENHELSVYNQYVETGKDIHEVYWDSIENMPYILFEDKRMYFPYNYKFAEVDGKRVVLDLTAEQQPTSPHLYIKDDIRVDDGDVIADVGVCEGNFALRYVERASKVYLFECESIWIKPLEKTFKKFKEKVVISNRFVGRGVAGKYTSIDAAIKGRLDFLKMDIEGAEVDALIGARQTLMNNNVKCAICSYHRMNDEVAISDLLRAYGYQTSHSDGYMFFLYDSDMTECPEFRRGIVYGKKI